jgi:hypothetical protein
LLTVTNTASEPDPHATTLGYGLVNPPSGMSISTNGIITWTPSELQAPSTNTITTVVTNSDPFDLVNPQLTATNSFTVIVQEMNTAPVLPAQSIQTIAPLATLTVTNTGTDSDVPSNALAYVLVAAPAGATINANGIITWTPTEAQGPSTNIIMTVVTDSNPWAVNAQHLTATNSFTVVVSAPIPVFKITSIAGSKGVAVITWNSVAGNYYRLQYKNNLLDTNWTDLSPDILATGPVTTTTNVLGGIPQRFYRVQRVTYQSLGQPVIQSLVIVSNTVKVTWTSVPGHIYGLQSKQNLTDVSWTDVLPDVTATGTTTEATDPSGVLSQRFYRICLRS